LPADPAGALLARMRAACGGDAWDRVRGWHETGTADLPGMAGVSYETWHDIGTLKSATTNRLNGQVMRRVGFDGAAYWQARGAGTAEVGRDPERVRRQRRDAYISSFAFFFPNRFPARFEHLGRRTTDDRSYDVLRVTPEDSASVEIWVDPKRHRVARFVAEGEYADLGDYRTFAGGICSATTGRQGDGDPAHDLVLHVGTVETGPVPASIFAPPTG
jgi:hypothetical protein